MNDPVDFPVGFVPQETVLHSKHTLPGCTPVAFFYVIPNYERAEIPANHILGTDPPPMCHPFLVMRWDLEFGHALVCGFPFLDDAKLFLEWVVLFRARRTQLDHHSWLRNRANERKGENA